MFSPVIGHGLCHMLVQLLPVRRLCQIDKINHNDPAHIAQSQLSGYLIGRCDIDIERRLFLLCAAFHPVATIDVDHVHCFRMLDNQVGPTLICYGSSKQRLNLSGNTKFIKNRHIVRI